MKESTRSRVVSSVASAIMRKKINNVYDYQAGKHRQSSAEVVDGRVQGYDYDTSTHFSGSGSNLDFYDHETCSHVQLKIEGDKFSGFDHHSGSHFSGKVSGNSITIYDYETGKHYNFSA